MMAKGVGGVCGTIGLPPWIQNCKWITLVTLSGSDKVNDLLLSQIDSLIC